MIGRTDVILSGRCALCEGRGRDPKNRTRTCPSCVGTGKKRVCTSCHQDMPCPGTDDVLDQTHCSKPVPLRAAP